MTTKHTPGPWYTKSTETDRQGLVISETTGANVAVTYDPKDAAIVAASPDLLAACHELLAMAILAGGLRGDDLPPTREPFSPADWLDGLKRGRAAIAKAEGRA
jgi:hypothetical protein